LKNAYRTAALMLAVLSLYGQGTSTAFAQAPKAVVAPIPRVNRGDIVQVDASESKGTAFLWVPQSGKTIIPFEKGKLGAFASGTDGDFEFTFIAGGIVDGAVVFDKLKVVIQVGDPAPKPPPIPIPPDPPKPPPIPPDPPKPPPGPVVTGRLFATYVSEDAPTPEALSAESAAIRTSLTLASALEAQDVTWRFYLGGDREPIVGSIKAYLARPEVAGTLPAVVVTGPDGVVRWTPLKSTPESKLTEARIIDHVKTLRGSK
jgi:hypothetical protein